MKGRKPKPTEQKIAEGNPGHRPLPEPMILGGRPEVEQMLPPDDLPQEAKDAWNAVVPTLLEVGALDLVDRMALKAMCIQWARGEQAGRVIASEGHIARGSTGQLTEHPSLGTERSAHSMFLRFAEQYGLTASARARIGLANAQRKTLGRELDDSLGEDDLTPAE